jgi:hypothetical protein
VCVEGAALERKEREREKREKLEIDKRRVVTSCEI